jgi:hypothetical protein
MVRIVSVRKVSLYFIFHLGRTVDVAFAFDSIAPRWNLDVLKRLLVLFLRFT